MAKSTNGSDDDESLENSIVQQIDDERESDTLSCTGTHHSGTSHWQSSLGERSGSAEGPTRPVYVDPVVAEKEQRQVQRSRRVVIAVLLVSSAILAITMYLIVSRGEHETFQKQVSVRGTSVCLLQLKLCVWYVPKSHCDELMYGVSLCFSILFSPPNGL
jgi:hypothetical protein